MGSKFTAEEAVRAVKESGGFVTVVARRLNCSVRHVYNLVAKYESVKDALFEERESMKDLAEGEIVKKIQAGETTMIIFYAKTQMKDRGYVERQEYTGKDGEPMKVDATWRTVVDAARADAEANDDNA